MTTIDVPERLQKALKDRFILASPAVLLEVCGLLWVGDVDEIEELCVCV